MRALVTGASSGIGRAFAHQLAEQGWDQVIVARTEPVLTELAAALSAEHGTNVDVVAADLTDAVQRSRVETLLADPASSIDLLVNNAGYGSYGPFAESDIDVEAGQVELNIEALVRLTHSALGPMLTRKRGGIINISSTAGAQPMPYSAVYAASKAFVTSFTHALVEELRDTGVHPMAVLPGFTRTEFHSRADVQTSALPSLAWMDAEEVAKTALRDYGKGKHICIPGILNRATVASATISPPTITRRVGSLIARKFS